MAKHGFRRAGVHHHLHLDRNCRSGTSIDQQARPFFAIVAGVVTEAVSSLFFVQSNRSREHLRSNLIRLRADDKYQEALRQADHIDDHELRDRIHAYFAIVSITYDAKDAAPAIFQSVLFGDRQIEPATQRNGEQ